MKRAALLLLLALPAQAQQIERVIVTAPKYHFGITPNSIAHDFVHSFATPTALRDAIARWQIPICPEFQGIAPQFASVMESHLRAIAGQAGAAMKQKGCKPNLLVAFTSQPQTYLDALHAKFPEMLGYHGATEVSHAIQAWYETGVTDVDGNTWVDQEAWGLTERPGGRTTFNGPTPRVSGLRFHPDVTSDVLSATIIIDTGQTGHNTVSQIADYVAMMALSRTEDYDDCQLVPSIANLLSASCDDKLKPDAITLSDIAYLRGVYKMDAGAVLQIQQDQIAAEMAKTIPAPASSK